MKKIFSTYTSIFNERLVIIMSYDYKLTCKKKKKKKKDLCIDHSI